MHQQLWGYKLEEKLYVGVREQKRLNTIALNHLVCKLSLVVCQLAYLRTEHAAPLNILQFA
jgi:hypothetical protein